MLAETLWSAALRLRRLGSAIMTYLVVDLLLVISYTTVLILL
jgi:hypothetical protein